MVKDDSVNIGISPGIDCEIPELLSVLPSSPAMLLLVGNVQIVVKQSLRSQGYHVDVATTLGDGSHTENYAAIVIGNLGQGADSILLFSRAYDLLTAGGFLLLLEPIAYKLSSVPPLNISRDEYLARLATRYGFTSEPFENKNVNQKIIRFVKRHRQRWRLSVVRESDMTAVLNLFHKVFGCEMTPSLWKWKYSEGRGCGIIACRNGMLVAHYGGIARRIMFFGKPQQTYQITDVMVDVKERAVMTKSGPFFLTAAAFLEIHRAEPLPGFGFPNARAMKLAEKLGLYAEIDCLSEIRWRPALDRPRVLTRVRHLSPNAPETDGCIDRLWGEMANDLRHTLIGVRDANYIRHRYFNHPEKHYEVLVVTNRFTGIAHGVMVLRRDQERCELLDIIAPLRWVPQLINQARRLLSHWGHAELFGWITHQHVKLFSATGGTLHQLDIRIPSSIWVNSPNIEMIRNKWWLMGGDTDFR